MRRALLAPALLLLPVLLAGCMAAECSAAQGAGGQEGVCTKKDEFYFGKQGTFSGTQTFSWENSGSRATVAWGGQGSGTVKVVLKDAAGKEVFARDFSGSGQAAGSHTSAAGEPGSWTVVISSRLAFQGQVGVAVRTA